jgi:hypothetical protein
MRYRVVNLVIYDEAHEHERLMRRELARLARHTRGVTQLFVSMSPRCDAVHQRDGVLYVPGRESYIPGILHKTLEAMAYCARHLAFDFIVRSNISTVIDFERLPLHELTDTLVYASAYMWNKDDRSRAFASGTNIILNRAAVDFMLMHRDLMLRDTIDDVAIGALMSSETIPRELSTKMVWNDDSVVQGAVFRNRSDDRYEDVARMRRIVDRIIATRIAPTGDEGPTGPGPTGLAGPKGPKGPTAHRAVVALIATALFTVLLFLVLSGSQAPGSQALIHTKSKRGG